MNGNVCFVSTECVKIFFMPTCLPKGLFICLFSCPPNVPKSIYCSFKMEVTLTMYCLKKPDGELLAVGRGLLQPYAADFHKPHKVVVSVGATINEAQILVGPEAVLECNDYCVCFFRTTSSTRFSWHHMTRPHAAVSIQYGVPIG